MTDQRDLLARIASLLTAVGIPHMVVGSVASSFHGAPRTTRDIDVLIDPDLGSLHRLVRELESSDLYVDVSAAEQALERRTQFNVVDRESGWKVDLIVRRDRPFSREELRRRLSVRLLGVDTHVATAEDTIIAKLEWAAVGSSERQLLDVASIIAVSGDELDVQYLDRWIAELDLAEAWSQAQQLAAQGFR